MGPVTTGPFVCLALPSPGTCAAQGPSPKEQLRPGTLSAAPLATSHQSIIMSCGFCLQTEASPFSSVTVTLVLTTPCSQVDFCKSLPGSILVLGHPLST